jgi:acylphosphatase
VLTIFRREGDGWSQRQDTRCRFVPLLGDGEPEVVTGGKVAAGPVPTQGRRTWRIGAGGPVGGEAGDAEVPEMKSVSVRVSGSVQGVFYRASAAREGQRLGLSGWVRNERDGSVALFLQGKTDAVDAMLAWCRVGPPAAHVDRVEVSDASPDEAARGFEVR